MKSDSEEARRGSNISLKINYNIKTVGKNIGLKPGLKLHHFAFKMLKKSCKGGCPPLQPPATLTRRYPEIYNKKKLREEYQHTHDK